MSHQSSRRLLNEFREASRSTDDNDIRLAPDGDNFYSWSAELQGPPDSPYQGGQFRIAITVPPEYPNVPPSVRFVTKCFHPNIHFENGEVCLDILKTTWTPAWTLMSVCRAVIALLSSPEADSPLNCDAGNLLRSGDERGFRSMAKMYTDLHAQSAAS